MTNTGGRRSHGGYDPFEHADRLGITVSYGRVRSAFGLWLPTERTILLKPRMRVVLERSVLAHELGHAVLGHPDDRPRFEFAADKYAARRLIQHDHLRDLARQTPDHAMWAAELQVTPHLLSIYLRDQHHVA